MLQALYEDTKDESYGAACSFEGGNRSREILICDDTLIGRLAIRAWGYVASESDVLSSTKTNYPAGV
ncbi:hypothetical protein EOS_18080 [Caballeronia mineralivorans PML1(12)]|uniref:Uncharacterized protein n=1 Tax=Caballeronia mineralivorans PML1(12) TaxID=908627 RepID=A0A0J1CVY9_9BURK|nr:hypothetical protein EOS_18080 [Caballeronia mineralivorans PML1(12)]